MVNTIVWADIPVRDMERARKFYGRVLEADVAVMEGSEGKVALLPGEPGSVTADLALTDREPSTDGCTIYLNSYGDGVAMLERAVAAGGELLMPLTDMGPMIGSLGYFKDSEGNRIGVHQPPAM
ncbi:MAG: VOC family protein [Thermoleophilia bacterium]